ncbi:hypothetical protein D3C76_1442960 [compost metagenome]
MADLLGGHARALDGGAGDGSCQVGQGQVLERASKTTDGGTHGTDDVDFWAAHRGSVSLGMAGPGQALREWPAVPEWDRV